MKKTEWALFVGLVIGGLYFIVDHKDPLPLNHEAIRLGDLHIVHTIIGIVLIGMAGFIWWRSKRTSRSTMPA